MDSVDNETAMMSVAATASTLPVLGIRMGRGRTGGSTFLDGLVQRARNAGRNVVIADGDVRNSTLSGLYPPGKQGGALKPVSEDFQDMKNLFTQALGEAASQRASLLVDFGGGDRVMQDYGRETDLVEMAEDLGMAPVAIYVTGPEADDFEHIVSLWRSRVFRPERSILVLNQHLVGEGRSADAAFRTLVARPELADMGDEGLEVIVMPRMPCMTEVRELGLGLMDAKEGKVGEKGVPLDVVRRFMVRAWFKRLEEHFEKRGVTAWLP